MAGSTIAVVVRVSVRVSVRTRSVPNLPADTFAVVLKTIRRPGSEAHPTPTGRAE